MTATRTGRLLAVAGVAAASMLVCCPNRAHGELLQFEFSGTLTDGGGLYSVGDPFSGSFSYDTDLMDDVSIPDYFIASVDVTLSVHLSGHSFVAPPSASIWVYVSTGGTVPDTVVVFDSSDTIMALAFLERDPIYGDTLLGDSPAGDTLPSSLHLEEFQLVRMAVADSDISLIGTVNSLRMVPEPSTFVLAGVGVIGLLLAKRLTERS